MILAARRLLPGPAALLAAVLAASAIAPDAEARRRRGGEGDRSADRGPDLADPSQEAAKFFQFGNQYFQQGLLNEAEGQFQRALSIQPAFPEASYMLALVHLQLNDYHAALRQASSALEQNPFFTEAHNVLGFVYAKMGRYDDALREFQAVLGDINFPTPEVAHFNIGKVFWEQGGCGDAIIHFRRALEVNPQFGRAWYLLGDCQEQLGQAGQAKESYRKAIAGGDEDVRPMFRLGYVCFQEGDAACARTWFDKVRTLAPSSDMAKAAREYIRTMEFR